MLEHKKSYDDDVEIQSSAVLAESKSSEEAAQLKSGHGTLAMDSDLADFAKELDTAHSSGKIAFEPTPEEERQVLRKIDRILLPIALLVYLMTFVDKTTTNYAHLLNYQADLGFNGSQYSWLGSQFYLAYLVAQPLHALAFQKLHVGKYLGACAILWGVVLTLHAACFNYAALVACRLFLGFFEAAITPGLIIIMSRFYRRREQVARTAVWFSSNCSAQILGALITYGVLRQKPGALPIWRELFIILGLITVLLGLFMFFLMPSTPDHFPLLTHRERLVAVWRVSENQAGLHNRHVKGYQIREAFLDIRLYLLFFTIVLLDLANGGSTNFGSAVISSLGFNKENTALLGMAVGFSELVGVGAVVVIERTTKKRWIAGAATLCVGIAGAAMLVGAPTSAAKMAGYCLMVWFACPSLVMYATLSSSVAGETKRMTFNAVFQIGYSAGNIIGPQVFLAREAAKGYPTGKGVTLAAISVALATFCALFAVHGWENRKRDRKFGKDVSHDVTEDLSDLTDKERAATFRYPL